MRLSPEEERALVLRWKDDPTATRDAINQYGDLVRGIAYRFLKNAEDADEITNDVFRLANRSLATFRGDSSLATWLSTIARNLSSNRYAFRKRRRYADHLGLDATIDGTEDGPRLFEIVPCGAPGPAANLDAAELLELIMRALETLSPEHREIIHLRYVRRLGYDELGEAYGINFGTVKSRLARAREKLKTALASATRGEIRLRSKKV